MLTPFLPWIAKGELRLLLTGNRCGGSGHTGGGVVGRTGESVAARGGRRGNGSIALFTRCTWWENRSGNREKYVIDVASEISGVVRSNRHSEP